MVPYTAVVLAGGRAARLGGRAKPQLEVGGRTMLAAVSAPSSLAVELAADVGITLVGFLRGDGCNVYTHQERLVLPTR